MVAHRISGPTLAESLARRGVETGKPIKGHWTKNLRGVQHRGKGRMNKTEAAWAAHLDELKAAGEVLWWRFQPCRLRLTDTPEEGGGTALYYTPDFEVAYPDRVEMHDTKGGFTTQHGWSNLRAASEVFPIYTFAKVTKLPKKDGGGFKVERL